MVIDIHNQGAWRPFFPGMVAECLAQGMAANIAFNMGFQSCLLNNVISAVSGDRHKVVVIMAENIFGFIEKGAVLPQQLKRFDAAFIQRDFCVLVRFLFHNPDMPAVYIFGRVVHVYPS